MKRILSLWIALLWNSVMGYGYALVELDRMVEASFAMYYKPESGVVEFWSTKAIKATLVDVYGTKIKDVLIYNKGVLDVSDLKGGQYHIVVEEDGVKKINPLYIRENGN